MRRKEREITDRTAIEAILAKADICRIAFNDKGYPYIVPMNFGYKDNCLYFHSAPEGRKIDLIKKDDRVAFEVSTYKGPVPKGVPCGWKFEYRSVMGVGRIHIIDDPKAKKRAVDILIRHYSKRKHKVLPEKMEKLVMLKLEIERMTAKGSRP